MDITTLAGRGAAGGLAGGLAALGAGIVSGFELVADFVGLDESPRRRGPRDDRGGLPRPPVLRRQGRRGRDGSRRRAGPDPCASSATLPKASPLPENLGTAGFEVVSLVERFGPDRARSQVLELLEDVVAEHISAL